MVCEAFCSRPKSSDVDGESGVRKAVLTDENRFLLLSVNQTIPIEPLSETHKTGVARVDDWLPLLGGMTFLCAASRVCEGLL